jgi:hypothetical protein
MSKTVAQQDFCKPERAKPRLISHKIGRAVSMNSEAYMETKRWPSQPLSLLLDVLRWLTTPSLPLCKKEKQIRNSEKVELCDHCTKEQSNPGNKGMEVHSCNPSTQVQGQPETHSEILSQKKTL